MAEPLGRGLRAARRSGLTSPEPVRTPDGPRSHPNPAPEPGTQDKPHSRRAAGCSRPESPHKTPHAGIKTETSYRHWPVDRGLAARKALPGSRAARRVSIRPRAGWTGAPSCFSGYARCAAETRTPGSSAAGESGRRILMPHGTGSPRYGGSASATRIAATSTLQVSVSFPLHAARAATLLPALMQGPRGSPCLAHLGPSPFRSRPKMRPRMVEESCPCRRCRSHWLL